MRRSVLVTWGAVVLFLCGLVYAAVEVPTDIQATDLSSVGAIYPWSDKRTLYLQIKRRYRVIHTFPIRD